ncbi:MAG: hypothetical protein V4451_04550 [Pseudomonadota bacterium]
MTEEKPAEMRPLMKLDKGKETDTGSRKRPSLLSLLQATFLFVGGIGRALKLIDDIVEWWSDLF